MTIDVSEYSNSMTINPADGKPMPLVSVSGSKMEEYIPNDAATKPDPTTVPIGCILMSVATGNMWQSDGTSWVVF